MKESPVAARRRSRELALQGLYEWAVGRGELRAVDTHMREQPDYERCDAAHFDALLRGVIEHAPELDKLLSRHLDRRIDLLSPVEHAALRPQHRPQAGLELHEQPLDLLFPQLP